MNQVGWCGAYFIVYFQSATPRAAIPIADPGWPMLNCSQRSATRRRKLCRTSWMSSLLASFPEGAVGFFSFLRRALVMFSPYLVDRTGLSTSVEAALRLGILSIWRGGDGKCERQPRVNESPLAGREREAIRGKIEVAYRSSNNLCFLEPDESTRVCHDAYSQPYFGARRGNAPMHAEEELRSLLCHDGGVICRRQKAIEMEVVMDEGLWRFVEMCYRGAWSFYDGALNGCTFPFCNLTSPPRSCFSCRRFPRRLDRQTSM